MKKQILESIEQAAMQFTGCTNKNHDNGCHCDAFIEGATWLYLQMHYRNKVSNDVTEFNALTDEQRIDRLEYCLLDNMWEMANLEKNLAEAVELLKEAQKVSSLGSWNDRANLVDKIDSFIEDEK